METMSNVGVLGRGPKYEGLTARLALRANGANRGGASKGQLVQGRHEGRNIICGPHPIEVMVILESGDRKKD